ncbi:MAG: hypothetical protein JNK48_33620 [Bryobacterales bacterium]|nr:hypothetical protein [Bryobacterales bacterium]
MKIFILCLAAAQAQTIDIGSRKQLFIDHKFIESAEGIRLTVNAPYQTREKLVTADAPWEKDAHLGVYSTVAQEGGKIRMWYDVRAGEREAGKNPPFMGLAYAESRDGLRFEKPVLNLVERNGTKRNNLVFPTDPGKIAVGGGSVWRDENPAAPEGERYKSWSKVYPKPGSGLTGPHRVWTSPDGIHWKLDERLVTGLRAADTQPSWFWDPRVRRYIGYSREWVRDRSIGFGARHASYNESDDMFRWDSMQFVLGPDERDAAAGAPMLIDERKIVVQGEDVLPPARRRAGGQIGNASQDAVLTPVTPLDFYGPGVFPYEGVYLALIPVFYHWAGEGITTVPSTFDVQFAVSRDGRNFTRPGPRAPFLRTGPAGSFDSKMIYPALRPVRMGNELWIYYTGTNHDHSSRVDPQSPKEEVAISRAVMRVDGFVSADADYEGGSILTPPLRFTGSRLELNVDTSAGGVVRVEIQEESGKPVAGFAMHEALETTANDVKAVARWKNGADVTALAGKTVRLRFLMRSAKLYAFQFAEK